MNKNLPAAIKTIRELLAGDGDVAQAIAHALDGQGLLVDPMRTFGAVLRRTREGWEPITPTAPSAEPSEPSPVTELEQQASHWDTACERARQLAATLAVQYRAEPDVTRVTADRDTVVISLHITDLARWTAWMDSLGITEQQVTGLDYVMAGRTSWDGIPLSVLGYDVPELQLAQAAAQAHRPYRHGGVVYDLAVGQRDITGDVWFFQGETSPEGMPYLSADGRPERCTLANVVELVGPLTAVREAATVAAAGGERA